MNIYAVIFMFVLIASCTGQEKGDGAHEDLHSSNMIGVDTAGSGNRSSKQTEWIDPLFYIEGQLCEHLRKIFQDSKGNLWFGTNVYGIMRYDGDTLVYFDEEDGAGQGRITGIAEDDEGNVWFATYGGLSKYDGKIFSNYNEEDGLPANELWSLLIDKSGILWIGTNNGVTRFNGIEFESFPLPKAKVTDTTTIYSYDRITGIIEDRHGNIWFGTDGFGIVKYDPQVATRAESTPFMFMTTADGLCDNNIAPVLEDREGNIWFGSMFGGLSKYDGKSFTNYTRDGVIDGIEISCIYEDRNGDIWIAVENHGVYRYDGESFTNLNEKDGLNTNGVLTIYRDRENRFWFGGWGGLFRYYGESRPGGGTGFVSVTKDGPWSE